MRGHRESVENYWQTVRDARAAHLDAMRTAHAIALEAVNSSSNEAARVTLRLALSELDYLVSSQPETASNSSESEVRLHVSPSFVREFTSTSPVRLPHYAGPVHRARSCWRLPRSFEKPHASRRRVMHRPHVSRGASDDPDPSSRLERVLSRRTPPGVPIG